MNNPYKVYAHEDKALMDYLSKDVLLNYISEEKIFSLVFGFEPEEYMFYTSPLRPGDTEAGAYFERYYYNKESSKLLFKDWADPIQNRYDCFDMVQRYFNLPTFKSTLQFIKTTLIDGKNLVKREKKELENYKESKGKTLLQCALTNFTLEDKYFWEPYGITSTQLKEDCVSRVSRYFYQKASEEYRTITNCYNQSYVYEEFKSGNKKIYSPYNKKKFITNCGANDIGGLNSIKYPYQDKQIIISKSYKDCRVLRNLGYNSIWFQNEGMIPDSDLLVNILNGYGEIIVFFDNDETGIKASIKLVEVLKTLFTSHITSLHLPFYLLNEKIKDPSDLYKERGQQELIDFLESNL